VARLKALESRSGQLTRAEWDAMTEEQRWGYLQELRTTSPAFAQIYAAAEQRIKALTDEELKKMVDEREGAEP